MKSAKLLIWITQLGFSTAVPLIGFIWLAVWLRNSFNWGAWVIVVGVVMGVVGAIDGLRMSLKAMEQMTKEKEKNPPVGFNDHEILEAAFVAGFFNYTNRWVYFPLHSKCTLMNCKNRTPENQ